MVTHTLDLAGVDLVYDVHGPLPTADGRPPVVLIGQPMDASGFSALVAQLPNRTTVTYDPRGLGRSVRKDGRVDHDPEVQAGDVRAVIDALGAGPVDLFASSGGAVTALALVAAHPHAVRTLVAHEPPLLSLLPDAEAAVRAQDLVRARYDEAGRGAGMAAFIAQTSWQGEFSDDYFAQPVPDPASLGMPVEDDGSRDDPLLSDRSLAVTRYRPDVAAIAAAPTRVVVAVGEESRDVVTGRCAVATADLLGQEVTVFPSHHGGFMGGEFGYAGQPEAFAARLRDVLDDD
jgi:pimeloyl-ACP methyl ester carboxylesterase